MTELATSPPSTVPAHARVLRRDSTPSAFDASKISVALTKAFVAVEGPDSAASSRIHDLVADLTAQVTTALFRHTGPEPLVHVEQIQDQVELALMRGAHHQVARSYVLYREERAVAREAAKPPAPVVEPRVNVVDPDGSTAPLDWTRVSTVVEQACAGLEDVDSSAVLREVRRGVYDGMSSRELAEALTMSARTLVEAEPNYSLVTARLLLDALRREALSHLAGGTREADQDEIRTQYPGYFADYVRHGIELGQLDPELESFDLDRIGAALQADRDLAFGFLGLQTLYDRYLLHEHGVRYELPQAFLMRVAMGLALREDDREARAIQFYELLTSFDFMCSTPTLFNAGTTRPQLSSCFLTTVDDDLHGIFHSVSNNALLSKYAGGLGNDWTPVRGIGAHIKGTNGQSQGVVPFLKIANDTAVAVNQCFAPETGIYTSDGAKAISAINTGDLVLGRSGKYREVLETYEYDQHDAMVEVNVKHSIEPLKVTAGHPFYAIQGVPMEQTNERTLRWLADKKVQPDWIDAGQLSKGDYVGHVVPSEIVPVEGLTEDDARLYGILLGDGHLSKNGNQWGVSGNPEADSHLTFVRKYLANRGIHYWETERDDKYLQVHWASGRGVVRDAQTGRITGAGEPTLPFTIEDIYDESHVKRLAPRLSHLPRAQTVALVLGLLETDGGISRHKEIYFTTTSAHLASSMRYQMLRLSVPTAGQYRERTGGHTGTRSDGTKITFSGGTKAFDIRVPAIAEIAEPLGITPLTKRNWIEFHDMVFSRVRSVDDITPSPTVHDLKVEGDESYMTAAGLAHNGGKRKGAVCAYLETWHIDIEEFLDLRKNTGDDRRRTHDMNTANWVPDEFLRRVEADGTWTLFSPDETPDLHDLYGAAFAEKYREYEAAAERGEMRVHRQVGAVDLWRRMITMLFETGHPWITFKDPCNLRSPQQHAGVVHSSNLCTEITLNTNADEVAVCNLGSVNLAQHVTTDGLDTERLERTVRTAVRMLDNVIDINFYTIPEARRSNLRHRPVGLGIMGVQDSLFTQRIPMGSQEAVEFADRSAEHFSYYAISASSALAAERGRYESYEGSLWSQGILPVDSLDLVADARGGADWNSESTLDWSALRDLVRANGMRNSNVMAIAPTATISNICGVAQSIEPLYRNLYVKSNMSGDFTVANSHLVADLKRLGLWDEAMVADLKYYDGSLGPIDRVPDDVKELYRTAFEVEPQWLVEAAARRQKWLDQAQSLNLYVSRPSGRVLDELYRLAWRRGLKTTYYLRSTSATHVEKSTLRGTDGKLNAVAAGGSTAPPSTAPSAAVPSSPSASADAAACSVDDPDCEACQ